MLRTARLTWIFPVLSATVSAVFGQEVAQIAPAPRANLAALATPPEQGASLFSVGPEFGMKLPRDPRSTTNSVADDGIGSDLGASASELQRLRLEIELLRAQTDKQLAEKRAAIEKARVELEEITSTSALEVARLQQEGQSEIAALRAARGRAELQAELAQARFRQQELTFKTQELSWNSRLVELQSKITAHEREAQAAAYVEQRPVYLKEPVQADGSLIISDRRIPLNGIITMETADFVCARIEFFNNKSKDFPIFIVIDDSPGGSVMAGYKILKTMESSTAPVFVVVKSFAASMAAAICTLAPRSFAYPNAVILHHQISNGSRGNLTTQRESVKVLGEWWRRLAGPIAKKMGTTIE